MKKLYVDQLTKVMEFDYNDMPTHRDEEADYIDEINEYSDYISVAEEKRLVAKA